MKEVVEKLLEEVDPDIKELMLTKQKVGNNEYFTYELQPDPAMVILNWQALRDRKTV